MGDCYQEAAVATAGTSAEPEDIIEPSQRRRVIWRADLRQPDHHGSWHCGDAATRAPEATQQRPRLRTSSQDGQQGPPAAAVEEVRRGTDRHVGMAGNSPESLHQPHFTRPSHLNNTISNNPPLSQWQIFTSSSILIQDSTLQKPMPPLIHTYTIPLSSHSNLHSQRPHTLSQATKSLQQSKHHHQKQRDLTSRRLARDR